jgi:uncharacterized membrane protein YedE/YeeE
MTAALWLLCGALFGAGACISGMVRPSKVLGFLDLGGSWDASLALVMASALAIHVVAWRVVARLRTPPLGGAFPPAPSPVVDRQLLGGAALFGIGWGLAGYCPGPAVVSIVSRTPASLVFVAAMVAAIRVTDGVLSGPRPGAR